MTPKEYCIAFCEGYFYAQLGEKLTNGKVTEHTLDLAKETDALADKHSQFYCVSYHRQPLVGTGFAADTRTLAEAIA